MKELNVNLRVKTFLSLIYEEARSTCDVLANVYNTTASFNYTESLESTHN